MNGTLHLVPFVITARKQSLGQDNIFRSVPFIIFMGGGVSILGGYIVGAGGTHPTGMHTCVYHELVENCI